MGGSETLFVAGVGIQPEHFGNMTPVAMENPRIVAMAGSALKRMLNTRGSTQRSGTSIIFKNFFIQICTIHSLYFNAHSMMPFNSVIHNNAEVKLH